LQAYCELIVYTFLPRDFCNAILQKTPELKGIFSHIICNEEILRTDSFLIKDIGLLLYNRQLENIVVVEPD
jgi:hypothetical protein